MKGREERKTDKREIEGREGNTKDKQGRKERLEGRDKDVGRAAKGREEEERALSSRHWSAVPGNESGQLHVNSENV